MMTGNFILHSQHRSIRINTSVMRFIITTAISILFALSPLFINNPADLWHIPIFGILLFAFSLIHMSANKNHPQRNQAKNITSENLGEADFIQPVIITQFARQNSANSQLFKTAA